MLENQLDAIDAAVFNGESMFDDDTRADFRQRMARWEKELKIIDAISFQECEAFAQGTPGE